MSATPRQKACIACTDSKRRCDKQLPECQRCLDRDLDCVYPQPKGRRRDVTMRDSPAEGLPVPVLQNYVESDALENGLDLGDWGVNGTANLDVALSDVITPYIPTLSDISSTSYPWFLQDDTWVLQRNNDQVACVTFVELEPFIHAIEDMLQCWVKNCHNSFIHRRLYEKGMPTCVQDAFTTLAAYTGRTPATKETILLIAEERSSTLARQSPPTTGSAQGIMAHLARVQALFVYEFIQLFDGSVRVRTSAEKQLPTLLQWVTRMWEAVKQYRGEDSSPGNRPLQWTASEFDREYDASSEMWQSWILTESVRRTHAISVTVANIYQIMTKGWAECTGGVMFTARRGLWEAESAMKWLQLSCAKPPLLVPSLQPGPWISQYAAEEFDDFAKLFWTFIVGKDKIQSWIDKSSSTTSRM